MRLRFCLLKKEEGENFGFWLRQETGNEGHIVRRLTPGGLAHRRGLREGDRILEVNGMSVKDVEHFRVRPRQELLFLLSVGGPLDRGLVEEQAWGVSDSCILFHSGIPFGFLCLTAICFPMPTASSRWCRRSRIVASRSCSLFWTGMRMTWPKPSTKIWVNSCPNTTGRDSAASARTKMVLASAFQPQKVTDHHQPCTPSFTIKPSSCFTRITHNHAAN